MYLPARTSATDSNPSWRKPPRMVNPCGSLTLGLSVIYTLARNKLSPLFRSAAVRLEQTGRQEQRQYQQERDYADGYASGVSVHSPASIPPLPPRRPRLGRRHSFVRSSGCGHVYPPVNRIRYSSVRPVSFRKASAYSSPVRDTTSSGSSGAGGSWSHPAASSQSLTNCLS